MTTTAAAASRDIPLLDIDPFALDVLLNPYPFQAHLREIVPVSYAAKYNSYAVGRYQEAKAILEDWRSFTSTAGAGLTDIRKPDAWRQPGPIVESDPPSHTRIRGVIAKILSPKVIRSWHEAFEAEAAALADQVCAAGAVDGARDIAEAFVTKALPDAIGLEHHRRNMVIVGNYNFNALGPKNALYEKSAADLASIAEWFDAVQNREGAAPGSFGEQVYQAEDAGLLDPGTARGLVRTMLRGGMDTTISGIGFTLMFLSQQPDLWQKLRADRSSLRAVFDESLRLESPIQSWFRTTTKAVELGGVMLEPDTKIQVFVGAANRDPRAWTDPDRFDPSRPLLGHLAFGAGIHLCIGQMIAKMEAESVLGALLNRIETLEPAGEPVYRPLNTLRTLDALPLRVRPA
jgi:cytochrome P450